MPITYQMIGTGMTERLATTISAPFGAEEVAALHCWGEASNQTCTWEGYLKPYELLCQKLFAKEKLPLWDKHVRLHADGRHWIDDVPEQILQYLRDNGDGRRDTSPPEDVSRYLQGLHRAGEHLATGLHLAYTLYPVDSEIWFACEFFRTLDSIRCARAWHAEESASCRMIEIGMLIATASLKFRWEEDALLGKRMREGRPIGTKNSALGRGETRQERQHVVREAAEALLKIDSARTKEEVICCLIHAADDFASFLRYSLVQVCTRGGSDAADQADGYGTSATGTAL